MSPRVASAAAMACWDIERIIAEFGGVPPMIAAHAEQGFKALTYSQVSNWKLRHHVPDYRLAELFLTLEHNRNVNIREYIKKSNAREA